MKKLEYAVINRRLHSRKAAGGDWDLVEANDLLRMAETYVPEYKIGRLYDWDGGADYPVPSNTIVTLWLDDDVCLNNVRANKFKWKYVTSFLIHSIPE